ncbi:hypothetical protein FACS1894199_01290 [Bacteroidia bacterium]|nr:hypothetical protein FACS1894199_01290 [Bacteroidia bacterium]
MKKNLILGLVMLMLVACGGNNERRTPPPENPRQTDSVKVKPTVNVYIENSGSMDGYVKGITEFEQTVYNYVSDIIISHTADSVNLFYINSKVLKQNLPLEDFIQKLEPTTFKQRGGNRGTSDIANVLGTVLKGTGKNQISILVTDGIFSPGRGADAEQYLVNQEIGIKRRFAEYLEQNKNAAVVVYQLSSKFNGTYYNKVDAKIQINKQRPYYIWVIGDAKQLSELRKQVPDSKFIGGGIKNVFTAIVGNHPVKNALNPSVGIYDKPRDGSNTITKLKKDSRTEKVTFAVNVNFADLLLDDSYLLNPTNYENSSKYDLEIKPSSTKNGNYTHILTFSSDKVYQGNVSVKLKAKLPAWVEEANDDNGSTAIDEKTFGIKYQLGGVFGAFTFDNNYYAEIKISIN